MPTGPAVRARLVARLGRRAWSSVYGAVSFAVTASLIAAAGGASWVEAWPQWPWTRWVPNFLVPAAILLAVLGWPARTVTRHPLLWALALWAGARLVPNGDAAHVALFRRFGRMVLAATPAFDARARRSLGPAAGPYFAATALRSLGSGRFRRETVAPRGPRALLALVIWGGALLLHPRVIGVSPLPA